MTRRTFAGDVSGPVRDFGNAYLDPSVFAGSLQLRLPAFHSKLFSWRDSFSSEWFHFVGKRAGSGSFLPPELIAICGNA